MGNELLTLLLAERAKLVPTYKDWLYFLLATGYATGQDVANILTIFKTAEEAFSGRQWPGISMRRAHLPQAIFDHTDLSGGDLRDSLVRTNFSDARIDGVIFGEYPALKEHKEEVTKVVYAPDDRQIASASADNTIRLWDTASGTCTKTLMGHTDWVCSVVYAPDGSQIASASSDHTIRLWSPGKTIRPTEVFGGECLGSFI